MPEHSVAHKPEEERDPFEYMGCAAFNVLQHFEINSVAIILPSHLRYSLFFFGKYLLLLFFGL